MHENDIGDLVVDCAVKLHMDLGPGLLESVYEAILTKMLEDHGLDVQRQVRIPIAYEGVSLDEAFRADLVVGGKVILELKSVEAVSRAHKKQLLTYLRLAGMKVGYILNFGDETMKQGIARVINGNLE